MMRFGVLKDTELADLQIETVVIPVLMLMVMV